MVSTETYPNIYLSTLAMRSETRGMGVTKKDYAHLFFEHYPDRNVYTRHIFDGFGFGELKRIPNDRGEGIDTVYFYKNREK